MSILEDQLLLVLIVSLVVSGILGLLFAIWTCRKKGDSDAASGVPVSRAAWVLMVLLWTTFLLALYLGYQQGYKDAEEAHMKAFQLFKDEYKPSS